MPTKLCLAAIALLLNGCSGCGSKVTLPDAHDGGTDEHTGASGVGGAGGVGAAGAAGGSNSESDAGVDAAFDAAGAEPDAATPIEIDRSGLIPTAGGQLILWIKESGDSDRGRLVGLDLETGELHALLDEPRELGLRSRSPDGSTLVLGGSVYALRNLLVAHALDDGLVPAKPVTGLEERDAVFFAPSWSDDGRFATFVRSSRTDESGVDLVDTWRHARHWTADAPAQRSASISIAPGSEWLSFVVGVTAASNADARGGFGRITSTGVDEVGVSDMWQAARFSADGTRAIYEVSGEDQRIFPTHYRDLRENHAAELVADSVGELALRYVVGYSFDADHALGIFSPPDGMRYAYRHVSIQDGTSYAIGEAGHALTSVTGFASGREFFVRYDDSGAIGIAIEDSTGARPRETLETFTEEVVDLTSSEHGERHVMYRAATDPRIEVTTEPHPAAIRFVARDESGVLQTAIVSEPDEQAELCFEPIAGRSALRLADGSVALLDLTEALARRVPAIVPANGGSMTCPIWRADGGAFAITERLHMDDGQGRTWVHVARWPRGSAEPGPLQLAYEDAAEIQVLLARP